LDELWLEANGARFHALADGRRVRRSRKPAAASAGSWCRHERDDSGKPCSRRTAPSRLISAATEGATSPATGRPRYRPGPPTTTSSSSPPPCASYLNRIASHFGAIGEFVVKNADYLDWDSFALAIAHHISYRNHPNQRRHRLAQTERRPRLAA
jgi:hypothetical protein